MPHEAVILIRRHSRLIPFGYEAYSENHDWLVPVPEQLKALEQAKKYRDQNYPYRSIRDWLIKATGRQISLMGLRKILLERKNVIRPNSSTKAESGSGQRGTEAKSSGAKD